MIQVEIEVHGDTYLVNLQLKRQTGPVDYGGVRPGR